jgi:hypothetical protein
VTTVPHPPDPQSRKTAIHALDPAELGRNGWLSDIGISPFQAQVDGKVKNAFQITSFWTTENEIKSKNFKTIRLLYSSAHSQSVIADNSLRDAMPVDARAFPVRTWFPRRTMS